MKKKLLSLALAFALCSGLCVPASATSTLSGGNAVWRFSNESTGKETVTIQEFSPGIIEEWNGVILNPDVQGSYTSHQETAYTFPIGTTITLQTPVRFVKDIFQINAETWTQRIVHCVQV